uniref:hypothetical protein n=1 Tax=Pedobacter schmidteae TaxID=2201271 RepID=UPI000EB3A74C|nr:hypothetical protein [Pedobacter schmidteae]
MKKTALIIGCMAIFCSSCKVLPFTRENNYIYLQKKVVVNNKWKLIWKDDFNGSVIDSTKWSKIPKGGSDWNKHMSNDTACYAQLNGK